MKAYKNPQLSIEERVNDLLSQMTLEEKIGQLHQVVATEWNIEEVRRLAREGKVGSRLLASSGLAGNEQQHTADVAEGNEVQRIAVEESRLGIPIINGRDVIHGHRTVFPIPLAQASSWDPDLVKEASSIAALEATSSGVHWTFAPMMDIARDPRWGRIIEGYGEDPYLCSKMAQASVRGFQGDDLAASGSIAACAKHYVGYGASEGGRDYNSVEITDNTLRNIYLLPFKAAVQAGVSTVMAAFNEIGGEPATKSHYLLTEVLKDEFGFDGFVVSDWEAIMQLVHQGTAANEKEAACQAFNAGVDMDMTDGCYLKHLEELVKEGKVSDERINDAVRRILYIKFKLGLFENPYTDLNMAPKVQLHPDHLACARKLAARSMVLLKNRNNILPLKKKGMKIAVIGPMVNERRALMGSWTLDGKENEVVSILEGIRAAAVDAEIITAPSGLMDDMILATRGADVAVIALGESQVRSGEANSVAELSLTPGQEELVEAVSAFGTPVVAVIFAGRPLAITRIDKLADAVLYAWHPGTQGGNAVADILFGDVNPSGKLPVTFPRVTGQVPIYYNHKNTGRAIDEYFGDSQFLNYHDYTGKPLYPFGFGLSYTEFKYDNIDIDRTVIKAGEIVNVRVRVKNIGERAGEEIVQCYIRDMVASATRPIRELKGFKRIYLEPGEEEIVTFALGTEEMSFYRNDGKWVLEPGEFKVWVGGNCLADLCVSFTVAE